MENQDIQAITDAVANKVVNDVRRVIEEEFRQNNEPKLNQLERKLQDLESTLRDIQRKVDGLR